MEIEKILEILACPKCKGDLIYENEKFLCKNCKIAFRIEDDIPVLLIEEATKYE